MIFNNQIILDRINLFLKTKVVTADSKSQKRLYQKGDLINDTFLKVYDILDSDKKQTTTLEDLDQLIKKVITGLAFIKYKNPVTTYRVDFTNNFWNYPDNFEKEGSNSELEAILIQESKDRLSNLITLTAI